MDIATLYFIVKIIAVIIDAAILAWLVNIIGKAYEARPDILGKSSQVSADAGTSRRMAAVQQAWAMIEEQAGRGHEGKRLAVIDADRLVDRLLKDAGFEGEGALDRMRQLPGERVATAAGLMHAHRFRNRLVHEVGFHPDEQSLLDTLSQYRAFLTELKYL
jgi:hypothetical protein